MQPNPPNPRFDALMKKEIYYEGKPHTCGSTTRYVVNGHCVACRKEQNKKYELTRKRKKRPTTLKRKK